jgi:S-formylglutathione hydrolase FrmB
MHHAGSLKRRIGLSAGVFLLCAAVAFGVGGIGWADGASSVRRSLAFQSEALGAPVRFSVYLPAGYGEGPARYPTIYLLHGHGGDETSWLDLGGLQEAADRMIADGRLPPSIIVTPSAKNGWYVDNQGAGRWQTALLDDLVAYVDATWRTDARGQARAIGGYSMGGYGALRFALLEPDSFVAAASLSGALFPDVKAASEFPPFQLKFFGDAFGASFDPKAFNAVNPWRYIGTDAADDDVPALYMAVGDKDIGILAAGNVAFQKALTAAGIPVTYAVVPGGHNWALWSSQLEPMLAFLGDRLKRARTVADSSVVAPATRMAVERASPSTIAEDVKAATPPLQPSAAQGKPMVARP